MNQKNRKYLLPTAIIDSDNNVVGGDSIGDRNVISDNGETGVVLNRYSDFNQVAGNYIGTKADGVSPLGNHHQGITIWGDDNTIGGFNANERNVIAANDRNGIYVEDINLDQPTDNIIINNYLGVDRNGNALGNGYHERLELRAFEICQKNEPVYCTVLPYGKVCDNSQRFS